ncbi:MAG: SEC-C domain-containing protein [Thiobacillus sp.]|nr:SEC-C domain-containing protein [Thiobacillus sp.]
MKPQNAACPCGSGAAYAACCGPCHRGVAAPDAERLMRSRYSAYVLGLEDYLFATWHPDTRPPTLDLNAPPRARWLGLEVKRHAVQDAGHATVEFIARYKLNGRACRLHETSRFVRHQGRWLYVDGDVGQ